MGTGNNNWIMIQIAEIKLTTIYVCKLIRKSTTSHFMLSRLFHFDIKI